MYSYLDILGSFPLPGSVAFEPAMRELGAAWLGQCPIDRATTYYFSQAGDDTTGDGSQATPWKSITKANTVLAPGVRCRLKRGDVWRDNVTLNIQGGCVDGYGVGMPPRVTGFLGTIASGGAAWTNATGDRWTTTIATYMGRILETDRPFRVYKVAVSTAEVEANANSFYYTGTTMHINAGAGIDPNNIDWEHNTAWPDSGRDGIVATEHGSRIDGVWTDGQGLGLSLAQTWGISAQNINDDVVCITNCHSYFHPRHNLGLFVGPGASGGKLLIQGCRWGFFDEAAGSAVANFANDGGHEVLMLDWECCGGQLPSGLTDPVTGNAFIAHTSGGLDKVGMHVAINGLITRPHGYGALGIGSVNDAPAAAGLSDFRAVTHRVRFADGYGTAQAILFKTDNVIVKSPLVLRPKDTATQAMSTGLSNGWLIDSPVQIDLADITQNIFGIFNTVNPADTAFQMVNSRIQWVRSGYTGFAVINRDTYFDGTGGSASAAMLNCVVGGIETLTDDSPWSAGTLYVGGANTASSQNNAYYGINNTHPTDDRGYGNTTGPTTLSYAPAFGGFIPDPSVVSLGGVFNNVPGPTGSEATAAGPMPDIDMREPVSVRYDVLAASLNLALAPAMASLDTNISTRSTFDPAAETVDVGKISGDAAAADNLESMLDGTGGAQLKLRELVINQTEPTGIAVSITANGAAAAGIVINATDAQGQGAVFNTGLTGINLDGTNVKAELASILTDTSSLAAIQNQQNPTADGVTDAKLRELILASLVGKTLVTDNGDGTKTHRFYKQDGTTPVADVTFNTNGEHTITTLDPAP